VGILSDLDGAPERLALSLPERAALDLNDLGNARRILSAYGDSLVYVTGRGWAVFDGRRYSFRDGDLVADELATELPVLIRQEVAWIKAEWNPPDWMVDARIGRAQGKRGSGRIISRDEAVDLLRRERAATVENFAVASGNARPIFAALKLARPFRRRQVDELDADEFALVVENGQVDLRAVQDGAPREDCLGHVDRDALPTRCAGVPFDADAKPRAWLDFLDLILPDAEVRACVQRLFGAMLFGENREQVAVVLRGGGGNGKSTLLLALSHVLGWLDGYAAPCQIELLIRTRDRSQGAATPDEINLPGARAYIATEPDERDVLSGKKIKSLTGGDRRLSRGNYAASFFEWTPTGIPVILCNRVPRIVEADDGLRQRLIFVPFDQNLRAMPGRRAQSEVVAELHGEGSAVLNWLLDGFAAFMVRGIDPPPAMLELKADVMEQADPVRQFLDEMTVEAEDKRISLPDFNRTFAAWCEDENHRPISATGIGRRMKELGFEQIRSNGYKQWLGLAWSADGALVAAKATGHDVGTSSRAPLPPDAGDFDDPPPF
jgi:putative DNA primase/helicase